jgi:hypothetical protein
VDLEKKRLRKVLSLGFVMDDRTRQPKHLTPVAVE